jgi:DNA-binding protein WhiA
MSFSADIKAQLKSAEIKKQCCRESFEAGFNLSRHEFRCDRDLGMFLRGAFLKCGSVSAPGRNFMLSFSPRSEEEVELISGILEDIDLPPKLTTRKGKPLLYYKASENIEDVLTAMGATKATLDIMNAKIISDTRNHMNRICNAETANLDRIATAGAEQRDAILYLEAHGALQNLPPELRECAELRLANPDMSLSQIRELLREPVSKSGLNHRFRKLIEIAEALKNV